MNNNHNNNHKIIINFKLVFQPKNNKQNKHKKKHNK